MGEPIVASCHCGAVRVTVPRRPRVLTDCNCSICRRYGVLWAYYKPAQVRSRAARGATESYAWGRENIRFVRCSSCGCVTHYERPGASPERRIAVNARCFDPSVIEGVRVRRLDGADTWKYLD